MLARQRRAVKYSRKYVISNKDIQEQREGTKVNHYSRDSSVSAESLLRSFDPDSQEADRRLIYEITGLRLNADEFAGQDSSFSDDEGDKRSDEHVNYAGVDFAPQEARLSVNT